MRQNMDDGLTANKLSGGEKNLGAAAVILMAKAYGVTLVCYVGSLRCVVFGAHVLHKICTE